MKKLLAITLSTMLAVIMLGSIVCSAASVSVPTKASDTGIYMMDINGKTDVLDQIAGEYYAPLYKDGTSDTNVLRLTDGIFAIEPAMKEFLKNDPTAPKTAQNGITYSNLRWCTDATVAETLLKDTGKFKYTLATGGESVFFYCYEWKELDCDVNSFALIDNQDVISTYANHTWWTQDREFQILVSQDGGKTYSIAYQSVPFSLKADGTTIESSAALMKDQGGEWTHYTATMEGDISLFSYRKIEADFNQEYKNVTNIVYGAVAPRIGGQANKLQPFYYSARISEFDVYGASRTVVTTTEAATTATPTTEAPKTEAPVVTTEAPKTEAPKATTEAPKTEAPVVTTEAPAATEAPKAEKGCGSSIAFAGVAVVMTLGCAVIRKKH